jgi:predicted ester cyclase
MTTTEKNKAIVTRFNKECIQDGNLSSLEEIVSESVINHSARPGMSNGIESFHFFLENILRKGFSNLRVEILDQVAECDTVATRKKITGKHTGEIFGIPPTNKSVIINVIDIIRLENEKYAEHWGQSNFDEVLHQLSQP